MKKFLIKFSIFFTLIFIAERMFEMTVPYHWGNVWYSSKFRYLKKHHSVHNTLFFGSSRTYRNINPAVFDTSVNQKLNIRVKSFNLGAPATACPQLYYLYENFLKDSELSKNTKYVMMELTGLNKFFAHLLHRELNTYWQNYSEVKFVINMVKTENTYSPQQKLKCYLIYSISYIENLLNLGHFSSQIMDDNYYNQSYLGAHNNGYYPLELRLQNATNYIIKNNLLQRTQALTNNPSGIKYRADNSIEFMKTHKMDANKIHLKRINALIEKSKQKGITLIFLLQPLCNDKEAVALYKQIAPENKIELFDASQYPQLYSFDNAFDIGHLNTKGSYLFSKLLADKFIDIISHK